VHSELGTASLMPLLPPTLAYAAGAVNHRTPEILGKD
jgi:hypothetical protein